MNKQILIIMLLLMTIFIGFGIIIPVLPAVVIGAGAKFHNALLLSVYFNSSMDSLGRIAGPLLGGAVYTMNQALPFVIGGSLCLAATMLLVRFMALDREPAIQAA